MKKVLFNKDKFNYSINLKAGVVLSLLICILVFLFYPKYKPDKKEIPYFPEPLITLIDIPNTEVSSHAAPPMPAVPNISSMLEPVDEPEPLNDFTINESSMLDGTPEGIGKSKQGTGTSIYEASSFPFIPRQTLEVVPQKVDGINGFIKVRVLVGVEGYVKQHSILSNTTNSSTGLRHVIEAVYKSRWQPISIEGEKVEYWIEKTYTFN